MGVDYTVDERVAERARRVRGLFLDVDGVLTDGSIIFDPQGRETKIFNVKDGLGIRMALKAGLRVALITGRRSPVVDLRAAELGVNEVHQGVRDKVAVFTSILEKWVITPREAAYVADDLPDLPVLRLVGLAVAVADAGREVLETAHMVTRLKGGKGAVREAVEYILRAQGLWPGGEAGR